MITVMSSSLSVGDYREGTPDSNLVHIPLSSHIAARSRREALRKKASRLAGGRHKESRPVRTSKRYGSTAGSAQSLNQALRSYEDLLGLTSGGTDGYGHLGFAAAPGL